MGRIEKTVFLSYRRTNVFSALAISQNLTLHGYDVFLDYTGMASGDFESVILENIRARAHFVVLLTPSALERCSEPGDWLRREIETAIEVKRNIIPLMFEGFDIGSPAIRSQLTGRLAALKSYHGLSVPAEYFDEAMERLRSKFLNIRFDMVLHPASASAAQVARVEQAAAKAEPAVTKNELTAEEWFERGLKAADPHEQVRCYTEAIRLKPDYAAALSNRGLAREATNDLPGALRDHDEAIRLKSDLVQAFNNRGNARLATGDLPGALRDYDEAIRLKPDFAEAFNGRGAARQAAGGLPGALRDYDEAIRLKPDYVPAFFNRGIARKATGDLPGALHDYDEAIRLKPDYAAAFNNRGAARQAAGDLPAALHDYDEALRLKPDFANPYYGRAFLSLEQGEHTMAVESFRAYLRLRGDVSDTWTERAKQLISELEKPL
jgi:tetratricopeptide (TPR) repeat protein